MRIRWTAPAAQDLYRITRYIRRDNPEAARKIAKTIYDGCESLVRSPHRGRPGVEPGTRELAFLSCPTSPYTG
jgi:plasmid stabilization system protein ParE